MVFSVFFLGRQQPRERAILTASLLEVPAFSQMTKALKKPLYASTESQVSPVENNFMPLYNFDPLRMQLIILNLY